MILDTVAIDPVIAFIVIAVGYVIGELIHRQREEQSKKK